MDLKKKINITYKWYFVTKNVLTYSKILQKFCKFSASSLKFQTFFSLEHSFLTLGQNIFGNKIPLWTKERIFFSKIRILVAPIKRSERTLFKSENEWQKSEPVPIQLPMAFRNVPNVKTRNKKNL